MSELLDIATRVAGWANDGEQVEAFVVHETETEVRAYEGEVESARRRKFATQIKELVYADKEIGADSICLLYTSPSPRDRTRSRMPSSA